MPGRIATASRSCASAAPPGPDDGSPDHRLDVYRRPSAPAPTPDPPYKVYKPPTRSSFTSTAGFRVLSGHVLGHGSALRFQRGAAC